MTEAQAARRGRPLLIAVRVPDSVGFAREIGIDFPKWLEEDLIDILIGGCYHHFEPWETMVAMAKRHDAPFYACLSNSRLDNPAFPGCNQDDAVWRGEAWRAWQAGVSGIHPFNRRKTEPAFKTVAIHRLFGGDFEPYAEVSFNIKCDNTNHPRLYLQLLGAKAPSTIILDRGQTTRGWKEIRLSLSTLDIGASETYGKIMNYFRFYSCASAFEAGDTLDLYLDNLRLTTKKAPTEVTVPRPTP